MKTSRIIFILGLALASISPAFGQALTGTSLSVTGGGASNLSGNLTVSGTLGAVGTIDSASNTFIFGTQSGLDAVTMQYTDSTTDTLKFLINRNPASWAWVHNTNVTAMRLDSAHQLILYKADGSTAGLTFTPVSNEISFGVPGVSTAKLTATGTALSTNGSLTVASGITNTNGSLTEGASGLTLNSGTAGTNLSLTAAGAGDIVFTTNSLERARIKSDGKVGIGTSAPMAGLDVYGTVKLVANSGYYGARVGSAAGGDSFVWLGSRVGVPVIQGNNELFTAATPLGLQVEGGNVGIGTTTPGAKLEAYAPSAEAIRIRGDSSYLALFNTAGTRQGYLQGSSGNVVLASDTGVVAFNANGSERMRIDTGGNVGIGTSSPVEKLQTVGRARFDNIYAGTWSSGSRIESNNASTFYVGTGVAQDMILRANGADALTVKNGGNIGIGTTSPGSRKVLIQSSDPANDLGLEILMGRTTGTNYGLGVSTTGLGASLNQGIFTTARDGASNFGLRIYNVLATANNYSLYSDSPAQSYFQGNVGIGTASPSTKLDVNGNVSLNYGHLLLVPGAGSVGTDGNYGVYWQSNGAGAGAAGYGLYRTAGGWSANNYQQLMMRFDTGIVIDGGTLYGKSGTVLQPNGGNVGIGTSTPTAKLQIGISNAGNVNEGLELARLGGATSKFSMKLKSDAGGYYRGALEFTQNGGAATEVISVGNETLGTAGNGNIGIGTTTPATKLHVYDSSGAVQVGIGEANNSNNPLSGYTISAWNNGSVYFDTKVVTGGSIFYRYGEGSQVGSQNYWMTVKSGNVGIGTIDPGAYKLAVKGSIHAQEVVVDNSNWADYVFEENYTLAPLSDVEAHIKAKKHLPGIPSAAEIAEHGVSMGDMQSKLLSKIEELTLHMIAQEKRAEAQDARIARLEQENRQLRTQAATP